MHTELPNPAAVKLIVQKVCVCHSGQINVSSPPLPLQLKIICCYTPLTFYLAFIDLLI